MTIESINDIAAHIIADKNLGAIEKYRDMPEIFHKEEIIDEQLEEQWIRMIGFRNILVHGYATVIHSEVYKIIQNHLVTIR